MPESDLRTQFAELQTQIEVVLAELCNEIGASDLKTLQQIETLRKTHVNLMISFEQMMDYIDMIRKPLNPGDIKDLLQTYVAMALSYYAQYEISLLNDIKNQHQTQTSSQKAIQKINDLNDPDLTSAITPLEIACKDAGAEYDNLLKSFPSLLQNAIDKLKNEWQRLGSIAVASDAFAEDKPLIELLKAVVDVAAHSIGSDAERIVIVPGKEFALYFFKYLDNFAVLTVPIYSVKAPWEWSVFWHELAGYKVRRLENDATLTKIREKLESVHTLYKGSSDQQKILTTITGGNHFSQTYLQQLLIEEELDLSDLGRFEHQFEQMLTLLPKQNRLQTYEQIKAQGWCVDWLRELFEDAWSVLAIGKPFLPFFEDVRRRYPAKDDRHPTLDVRLQVAKEILNLVSPGSLTGGEFKSKMPEAAAAKQILRFISLLNAATRKLETDGEDALKLQEFRDNLLAGVREEIQDAILRWSTQFGNAPDPVDQARQFAEGLIVSFSNEVANTFRAGFARYREYDQKEKDQITPTYENMLQGKDYKQLIELPFYDVDFHTPSDVQLFESGITYWVKPADWNSALWRAQRHVVGNGISPLLTQIVITEVSAGVRWAVNKADWNSWFKMTM